MRISDWSSGVCSSDLLPDGMRDVAQYLSFLLNTPLGRLPHAIFYRPRIMLHQGLRVIEIQHGGCRAFAAEQGCGPASGTAETALCVDIKVVRDRKSTRLNSSP